MVHEDPHVEGGKGFRGLRVQPLNLKPAKKMGTTIVIISWLHWDNEAANGNYFSMLGFRV